MRVYLKSEVIQNYQPPIVTGVVYLFLIACECNIMHVDFTFPDNCNLRYPSPLVFLLSVYVCALSDV